MRIKAHSHLVTSKELDSFNSFYKESKKRNKISSMTCSLSRKSTNNWKRKIGCWRGSPKWVILRLPGSRLFMTSRLSDKVLEIVLMTMKGYSRKWEVLGGIESSIHKFNVFVNKDFVSLVIIFFAKIHFYLFYVKHIIFLFNHRMSNFGE